MKPTFFSLFFSLDLFFKFRPDTRKTRPIKRFYDLSVADVPKLLDLQGAYQQNLVSREEYHDTVNSILGFGGLAI